MDKLVLYRVMQCFRHGFCDLETSEGFYVTDYM